MTNSLLVASVHMIMSRIQKYGTSYIQEYCQVENSKSSIKKVADFARPNGFTMLWACLCFYNIQLLIFFL